MKKVLFVCVENAGRSEMSEAFAKHYGRGKIDAASAGTVPSSEVAQRKFRPWAREGSTSPETGPTRSTRRWFKKQR